MIESTMFPNNSSVIYSVLIGDYDSFEDIKYQGPHSEQILFTNQDIILQNWSVVKVDDFNANNKLISRKYKILTHNFLSGYEKSLYIDANMNISSIDLTYCFDLLNNHKILFFRHPSRNCIYDEAIAVLTLRKDWLHSVKPQMSRYIRSEYPKKNGLILGGFILRNHNIPLVKKIMEEWFNEVNLYSYRDQLSYNYVAWQNSGPTIYLDDLGLFYTDLYIRNHSSKSSVRNIPKFINRICSMNYKIIGVFHNYFNWRI